MREQPRHGEGGSAAGPLAKAPSLARVSTGAWPAHRRLALSCQESQEEGLQRRLLDEQFAMLRGTAAEAERILQDAVGKLDDPLHLRCTSSPGRAAAAGARASPFPTSHPRPPSGRRAGGC